MEPMMTTTLPIEQLHAHPANSNVMPTRLVKKLSAHIERSGRYPPVIVRRHADGYQIIDGHHRVKALKQLARMEVRCEVWEVDDDEALLLLATLNRLQGGDDPKKRGALVSALRGARGLPALARLLPEDAARLRALSALHDAPPPRPFAPSAVVDVPVAVTFFVTPDQRRALDRKLKQHGGTRESALLELTGVLDEC